MIPATPTPALETLDAVDRAFVAYAGRSRTTAARVPPPEPATSGTVADRLLAAIPQVWADLATRVEEARSRGVEVVAISGAGRGTGRTTVVECLARTLAARGWRVDRRDSPPLPMDGGAGRDGGLVLVDAASWFPGGPLRRDWLQRQSLGCDAVILVRTVEQPPCAARAAMLESLGLRVLGEVLTMVPPAVAAVSIA